jgi:hypothetical protein
MRIDAAVMVRAVSRMVLRVVVAACAIGSRCCPACWLSDEKPSPWYVRG